MIDPKARWLKPALFVLCLLPLVWLLWKAATNDLGPDPAKAVVLFTGLWALRFLLLTLAISPLRQWLQQPALLRFRRMLGLYSWFYANLHLLAVGTYIVGWDWDLLREELAERPYMVMGFLAWLLMLPLGLTSNRYMVRKLGRRWVQLHRFIYPCVIAATIHLIWQVRSDFGEALFYAALAAGLLSWRLRRYWQSLRIA